MFFVFSDLNHTYCCMQVTSKSPVLSAGRLCCGEPSAHHPLCLGLSLHFKAVKSKANLSPGFSVVYSDVVFRNSSKRLLRSACFQCFPVMSIGAPGRCWGGLLCFVSSALVNHLLSLYPAPMESP